MVNNQQITANQVVQAKLEATTAGKKAYATRLENQYVKQVQALKGSQDRHVRAAIKMLVTKKSKTDN